MLVSCRPVSHRRRFVAVRGVEDAGQKGMETQVRGLVWIFNAGHTHIYVLLKEKTLPTVL